MNDLLKPFTVNSLTLRNRIVSTAHAPAFAEEGHPRKRYRLYHEEKARGGIGLTMIGGSTNIAADSPSVFGQLYAGDDRIIPWFQKLTDGVHQQGAAIMCQLTHMGRRTAWDDGDWLPVIAPSNVRERAHRAFPKVMESHDIDRVIEDFLRAAVRCQEGGFDGIELLVHSHLLGQFISPITNKRNDDYGGSLENRLRLTKTVLEKVRKAVGQSFVISLRLTGDELVQGGLTADECVAVAQSLEATGHADLFNILVGAPYDDLGLATWVPPMGMEAIPNLTVAKRIRDSVNIPILHAGGISDLATAQHAIAGNHMDLVGMTRAHMADPHLVNKWVQGQEERIRTCVGLGYCVDRVNQGKAAVCGQNAATGREEFLSHLITVAKEVKQVAVIGGGPAGLEAARVCAEKGHVVTLYEASSELGGQLKLASQGQIRRSMQAVTQWLISEVTHLGVNVVLNHYVDAEEVLSWNPDVVFVATGGWPEAPDIPGAELTLSSWDVLSDKARLSGEIIIFDETGDQAGSVVADVLSQHDSSVTWVTPDRSLMHDLGPTTSSVALKHLAQRNVGFECLNELAWVQRAGNRLSVGLRNVLTDAIQTKHADYVVVERGLTPIDEIYFELKDQSKNLGQLENTALIQGENPFNVLNAQGRFFLARIGDAVTGRNLHAALLDALRVSTFV